MSHSAMLYHVMRCYTVEEYDAAAHNIVQHGMFRSATLGNVVLQQLIECYNKLCYTILTRLHYVEKVNVALVV